MRMQIIGLFHRICSIIEQEYSFIIQMYKKGRLFSILFISSLQKLLQSIMLYIFHSKIIHLKSSQNDDVP